MQLFSLVGFSAFVLYSGAPSFQFLAQGSSYLLIDLFVGSLNVIGLMLLYRSFTTGNMSITAPIASSFPIFTILLGFLLLGQVIGVARGIAVAIVIAGVIISGVNLSPPKETPQVVTVSRPRHLSASVISAFFASIFFGGAYLGLNLGLTILAQL